MPRSGFDFDGRTSSISLLTRNSSPGRTGGVPAAGRQAFERRFQRRDFVEMIVLRIELLGESDNLVLDDAFAPGPKDLSDGVIFQILCGHLFTGSRANQAPPATAAALIRPKVASATDSAMKTAVRSPVQRSASQPPNAAMIRRARLARNGHNKRPAPWEAK